MFLLGLAAGVGTAHLWILKRITKLEVSSEGQARDIKTAFANGDRHEKQFDTFLQHQTAQTNLVARVVDQNNLLIQKIIVHSE